MAAPLLVAFEVPGDWFRERLIVSVCPTPALPGIKKTGALERREADMLSTVKYCFFLIRKLQQIQQQFCKEISSIF